MSSPNKRALTDGDSVMVHKPETTLPAGALEDIDRVDSKSSHAISISVSANAPPGLESSPISKDVTTLKDQVEFLYVKQKDCMQALNQVAIEQREAVAKTNVLISTLDQTVAAIKNQQDGMAVSERSLWDGINETRALLETSGAQWLKITNEIQGESSRSKKELHSMVGNSVRNIQEETIRTRQDLTNMGKMFSDQMNAIVNHLDKVPDNHSVEEEKTIPEEPDPRRSLRTSDGIKEWWYEIPDSWGWNPSKREPNDPTKFPTIHNSNMPANATVNLSISDPPKFDINRFESYRRDLLWWRDIHSAIDDSTLITTIAVKCNEELLKSIVSNFLEETRGDRTNRNFGNFIRTLDGHFEKTAQELALGKMSLWANFERKSSESIRNFWIRYTRVIGSLSKSGVKMPEEIIFSKALSAIRLEKTQLGILMSTLEAKGICKDLMELQRISIRLFETQFLCATDAILKVEEEENPEGGEDCNADHDDCCEEDCELMESFSNQEGEIFEIRKVGSKSSKSKGLKTNAVNKSRNYYGGQSTGKNGKTTQNSTQKKTNTPMKCWRCGGNHSWRQCHLPWQKTLAFGTLNNNNESNPTNKSSDSNASNAGIMVVQDSGSNSNAGKNSTEASRTASREEKPDPIRLTEDEWIAQYNLSVNHIQMVTQWEEISSVKREGDTNSVFAGQQQIVLDSGATSSVVGITWLNKFRGSASGGSLLKSQKRFKFGDSRVFMSLGITRIHIVVEVLTHAGKRTDRHFTIVCDVVPCEVPLLLSRAAMKNLRCCLDFEHNRLKFDDNSYIQLTLAKNGHLILPMQKDNVSTSHHLNIILSSECQSDDMDESNHVTKDNIKKLHLHLAHGSLNAMTRILKLSGKTFNKDDADTVIRECPCRDAFHKLQTPIVSSYIPPYPARAICLDIFFLPESSISTVPHLIVVCALTRFIVVCRLRNIRPETVIDVLVSNWIMYFGRMVQIVADRGPGLTGRCWEEFADNWSCQMSLAPKGSSHSNGMAERQVDLVKNAYLRAREMGKDTKYEIVLRKVVLAKNLTPNSSTGLCPMTSMIGRADILAPLEVDMGSCETNDASIDKSTAVLSTQKHLLQLIELRNFICARGAVKIIEACRSRVLRSGAKTNFKMGDNVEAFNPDTKLWTPNFTIVGKKESHLILEKGKNIHRHPSCWVRMMNIPHEVHLPFNRNASDDDDQQNEEGSDANMCRTPKNEDTSSSSNGPIMDTSAMTDITSEWGNILHTTSWNEWRLIDDVQNFGKPMNTVVRNHLMNWNYIFNVLWSDGMLSEQDDAINTSNRQRNWCDHAMNILSAVEEKPELSLEEENHLLSLTNPSRISPKIFLQIPSALASICDEVNNLLKADRQNIPGLIVIDYAKHEYKHIPRIHSTMIVKRKTTLQYKARLCARGDMLANDTPLLYSSPTVSRVSPRMILSIAVTLSLTIGIVDITSAFIQSHLIEKEKRLVIIPPYYIPLPWTNKVDITLPRTRDNTLALLTIRPLYGTVDAPIRWFITFSTRFKFCGWTQMESDPCIFRLSSQSVLRGICSLHVDDVLMAGDQKGWDSFHEVLAVFNHSGVKKLSQEESLVYLGVDIGLDDKQNLFISQQSFIDTKLPVMDMQKLYVSPSKLIPMPRRMTECKRVIGNLIWILQTRPDITYKLCSLSSEAVEVVQEDKKFIKWMRDAAKLMNHIREKPIRIYYLPVLNWTPKTTFEFIRNVQLYIFPDANFGTLRGCGSLQSYTAIIGRACARNGDITCKGFFLESCARRIQRVCKSTLAAEAAALSLAADSGLWLRVVFIEMVTGSFEKSIIQPKSSFRLCTPFSESPSMNTVLLELERNALNSVKGYELQSDSTCKEKMINQLFDRSNKGDDIVHWCKMLLMTDSANCYSSILSGSPSSTEKSVRIILPYLRDICEVTALTFIDQNYNMADSPTKDKGGNHSILLSFLRWGIFRIGFLGRTQVKSVKHEQPLEYPLSLKKEYPCKNFDS